MNTSIIEITNNNYMELPHTNPAAFSFSHIGAMGERGSMYIIEKDKKIYHVNYLKENFSTNKLFLICPPLKECDFIPIYNKEQNGWTIKYMGFGNFIVVNKYIKNKFEILSPELEPHELYKEWKTIVLKCLS